ncbi:MAG TPA: hypothetical protein VFK38_06195 [Candidatus Limnocylindrales bacterium]|nr:hypothetical protein [Candidatus Limnocylindrales bacterium]
MQLGLAILLVPLLISSTVLAVALILIATRRLERAARAARDASQALDQGRPDLLRSLSDLRRRTLAAEDAVVGWRASLRRLDQQLDERPTRPRDRLATERD